MLKFYFKSKFLDVDIAQEILKQFSYAFCAQYLCLKVRLDKITVKLVDLCLLLNEYKRDVSREALELLEETTDNNLAFKEKTREKVKRASDGGEKDCLAAETDMISDISTNETVNIFSSDEEDSDEMSEQEDGLSLKGDAKEVPLISDFKLYDEQAYVNSLFNLTGTKRKRRNSVTDRYNKEIIRSENKIKFSEAKEVHS